MNAQEIGAFASQILQSASQQARPATFSDMVIGFYHAVDWSEPWIIGLLVFHVLALMVRRLWRCVRIPRVTLLPLPCPRASLPPTACHQDTQDV